MPQRDTRNLANHSCESCGAEFISEGELAEHRRQLHSVSPGAHQCRLCGQRFGDSEELNVHLGREHGVDVADTVPCIECGLVFPGPDALEEHMDQEHSQRTGMG
jgi:hypothetical protein